ncbi:MAG: PilZ domain-containing protein [Nitrospiraceae bacterium]
MREPHCPQCGTTFIRVIHQPTFGEAVLQFLRIYPFRCQLCTHQFRAFRPGAGDTSQAFDRRQYKRLSTSCWATLVTDLLTPKEMILDISMGGCTVRMESPLPMGTFLGIQLQAGEQDPSISVGTAMVRTVRRNSVGIQFLELDREEKARLSRFIHGLLLTTNQTVELNPQT